MRSFLLVAVMVLATGCGSTALCGGGGGTPPVDACTSDVVGVSICLGCVGSGSGYTCTSMGCWNLFADGPCSAPFISDAGTSCPPDTTACSATEDGQRTCTNRVVRVCSGGCSVPVALCAG